MSSEYRKKLREIRKAEKLTQLEFSRLTGVSLSAIRNYESEQRDVGLSVIEKIVRHARFEKYTMWLMTDSTAPESGQIAPNISENDMTEVKQEGKEAAIAMSPQQSNMQTIINSIEKLEEHELSQLNKIIARKGSTFLLELLEQENQELLSLRGFRKFVALMLKDLDDKAVREILDRIERKTKGEADGLPETMQKTS